MSTSPERPRSALRDLTAPAIWALGLVSVLSLLVQVVRAQLIEVAGGCGWDGGQYCLMAEGQPEVIAPFNRRVLVPWLVHLLAPDRSVDGFRIVNAVALLGAAVALVWLGRRLGLTHPLHLTALVALFLLNPWTVRLYLSYPVLTDPTSLALLLVWCALVLTARPWAPALGVVVLVVLVLTREQWALVGVPAAWLAVLLGLRRAWWGLATTAVAAAAAFYAVTRPRTRAARGLGALLDYFWQDVSTSPTHAARFVFMVVSGLGLVALVVLARLHTVAADRRLLWITSVAAGTFGITVLGGSDVDRILVPVGVLLTVVATVLVSRDDRLAVPWVFLVVATVLLWHPFHTVPGDPAGWLEFYGLRLQPIDAVAERLRSDAALVLLPVLCAVAYGIRTLREPPSPAGPREFLGVR
ncbi:MAG TPA: hypothetical protein VK402_14925 [Blastococcus sp.]|nr:hypothetical protein [Blastococcus sp.]